MDEEQESSYQSENAPRYHAREVAKYLCVREKARAGAGLRHPYGGDRLGGASRGAIDRLLLRQRYNEQTPCRRSSLRICGRRS